MGRIFGFVAVLGVLLGCATVPVTSLDDLTLCSMYSNPYSDRGEVTTELRNRDLIQSGNWTSISNRRVRVGMSRCELYAAWGKPGDTSTYSSSLGRSELLSYYRIGLHGPEIGNSVYLRNGRIESIIQ